VIEYAPLKSVVDVQMGTAPPGESYNETGAGMPMIAGAGDYGVDFPSPKKWTTAPTRVASKGDLIVCVRATIGDINWADKEYCLGRGVAGVRAKPGIADIGYLAHYINAKKNELTKLGTGSTFLAIRRADLEEFPVPLPPLEEQKRIAAILDKADAIRRKRLQAIELADQFLRSVFLDMFGDPVTNPKGWNVRALNDLVAGKLQNGAYYPQDKYSESGVEMVHMGDAFYDYIQRGPLKRVLASEKDIEKYKLTSEDLLISRRSLTYEGAAKPSLIAESDEPLMFESSMIRVTPNPQLVCVRYLFHYLSDQAVKNHLVRPYVTGATIKGISQKNLEQVQVMLPPVELQEKFLQIAKGVELKAAKLKHASLIHENLAQALSQQAFKGQLSQSKAA
jgi:type I restriction enzyme, S subunit